MLLSIKAEPIPLEVNADTAERETEERKEEVEVVVNQLSPVS